jgi:hypothetical protein
MPKASAGKAPTGTGDSAVIAQIAGHHQNIKRLQTRPVQFAAEPTQIVHAADLPITELFMENPGARVLPTNPQIPVISNFTIWYRRRAADSPAF